MKKFFLFAFALALASCEVPDAKHDDDPTGAVELAKPIVLTTRGGEKVAADNVFAFRLFSATLAEAAKGGNTNNAFISPLSVTMALGMLYNGTSNDAGKEMADALGMGDFTPDQINDHYKSLARALLQADPKTQLAIANSIWSREGFAVKGPFLQTNRDFYDAEVLERNFDAQATVDEINKWCSNKTNEKIPEILDVIPGDAMMYLINAVYFKGEWKWAFKKDDTREGDFKLANGTPKRVKMMAQRCDFAYYSDAKVKCIEMPYGNEAFGMVVAMPTLPEGSLDELITSLDAASYNKILGEMHPTAIDLKFPRFKQECQFSLKDPVGSLGMKLIFAPGGNLRAINDDSRLAVSEIKQKTFVEVNELGTEAAAVTAIEVTTTSIPSEPRVETFHADRPFLYLIRERSTGAILFMGRMDNPVE